MPEDEELWSLRKTIEAGRVHAETRRKRAQRRCRGLAGEGKIEALKLMSAYGADLAEPDILLSAAANGRADTVSFLVERGATETAEAFVAAAKAGHVEVLRRLPGAPERGKAIQAAVKNGQRESVETLIAKGGSVDGESISVAVNKADNEMLTLLLRLGFGHANFFHIALAIHKKHEDTAILLLEKGVHPRGFLLDICVSAAKMGMLGVLKALPRVPHGFFDGERPLTAAVKGGNVEVVKFLLSKGHSGSDWNWKGHTPMNLAVMRGNKEIMKVLAESSTSVHSDDLEHALAKGNLDLVKLILELWDKDSRQWYPPIIVRPRHTLPAVRSGNNEVLKFILGKGSKAEHEDITVAAGQGNLEALKILFKAKGRIIEGKKREPVKLAVEAGHTEVVRLLFEHGGRTDKSDMAVAAKAGNLKMLKLLLEFENVLEKFAMASSVRYAVPITQAVDSGSTEVVRLLLQRGGKVENQHLVSAAAQGSVELLAVLTEFKGDIFKGDLLRVAVSAGRRAMVRCLLDKGLDVEGKGLCAAAVRSVGNSSNTVAHTDFQEIIRMVVEAGADVNEGDDGESPSFLAVKLRCPWLLRFLHGLGGDLNGTGGDEMTACMQAARFGDVDTVGFLIEHNADIHKTDTHGRTACMHACNSKPKVALCMLQMLVEKGADPKLADNYGETTLHLAARRCLEDVARYLVPEFAQGNAGVGAKDSYGRTAILWAAKVNAVLLRFFCEAGGDVMVTDQHGVTPLHIAADEGRVQACEILLLRGADVNAVDRDGKTPLHAAASQGRLETLRMLLKHGGNVDAEDNSGSTPCLAAARGSLGLSGAIGSDFDIRHQLERLPEYDLHYKDDTCAKEWGGIKTELPPKKHLFMHYDKEDAIEILVRNGADLKKKNKDGDCPLSIIVREFGMVPPIGKLIPRFEEPPCRKVPLSYSAASAIKSINRVIELGGDIVWAAQRSVRVGKEEEIGLLLSLGLDPNSLLPDGTSLCLAAVEAGRPRMLNFLLSEGARPSVPVGRSPLDAAIRGGNSKILTSLLSKEAVVGDLIRYLVTQA
eukprot:Hpha_TRINITY_DN16645_c3_g3::TRINITY_DN16645_c3_g3_i1::g.179745::m.179745